MCECASVASSYITNVKTAHFVYNPAAETRNSFALCDLWIMKMDLTNLNKRLWAIEYPGLVQNKDNMIKTLGGIANISKVNSNWCSETKKKWHILTDDICSRHFRQTNGAWIYTFVPRISSASRCTVMFTQRPAFWWKWRYAVARQQRPVHHQPSIPLKRKWPFSARSLLSSSLNVSRPEYAIRIVVTVILTKTRYFSGICDYQYVPLVHDERTNKTEFIYDAIVPTSIQPLDWLMWVFYSERWSMELNSKFICLLHFSDESAANMPYFLPPVLFTRVDTCQEGLFKSNISKDGPSSDNNSTIIGLTRNRRFKHATYIPFSLTDPIPDKSHPQAMRMLKFKLVTNEQFNLVKEVRIACWVNVTRIQWFVTYEFFFCSCSNWSDNPFGYAALLCTKLKCPAKNWR